MKVILRQNIGALGQIGEIVNVKDGYARNYLIPRQMAYFATKGATKKLEVEKIQFFKKQAHYKELAEIIAGKLSELQVSVPMKVGEEGKLFGSVTPQAIAKELSIHGHEVDKRDIVMDEPIKTLGIFDVKVKLHSEVTAQLKVWVVSEE